MPNFRKIRDARDAETCLAAAQAAGLTPRDWARSNGVNARSLHMWRVLLARGRRGSEPAPLRLVELVAADDVAETTKYRVSCGPFTVELESGFDDREVARLLRLVRSC